MAEESKQNPDEDASAKAVIRKRRRFSIVWLVPLVAALIAGGLWLQALQERGPLVTVVFDDGSGLEAGKSTVQFQGVEVGTVETVVLSKDLERVITTIRLDSSAKQMAQKGAEYWIVRPTFGIGGLSGLETLVSGSFIGVVPGDGPPQVRFDGLGEPPMSAVRIPGLKLRLKARELGSLSVGSPVAFRQIQVGEVTGYVLREDRTGVELTIVIYEPHRTLVREKSRFWNASGVKVSLGAKGLKIKTQSLAALVLGGVSFSTPAGDRAGGAAATDTLFALHENQHAVLRDELIDEGLNIILVASSLGSVRNGDSVFYREIQVGEVTGARLAPDSRDVHLEVNIWSEYAPLVRVNSQFWNASGLNAHFGLFSGLDVSVESLESLVAGGIAFATPDEPGVRVEGGSIFTLAPKASEDWTQWAPKIGRAVGDVVRAPAEIVRGGVRALEGKPAEAEPAAEEAEQAESQPSAGASRERQQRRDERRPRLRSGGPRFP